MNKKLSAAGSQLSAVVSQLTAYGLRLAAHDSRLTIPAATIAGLVLPFLLLTIHDSLFPNSAWAADAVTTEVTGVACTVIGLVKGIVGKMLAFIFLAAGAVSAFVGKWAYVAGGIGGGLLLIIGPKILETAFVGSGACP